MPENAIVAHDLVKVYRGRGRRPEVRALDGLSLTVPAGRVFGLLGPNGAGKSTTTKILTTLSHATSGEASGDGHDVRTAPDAVRAAIGYVSQGASTDPILTADENLHIVARMRGIAERDNREGPARRGEGGPHRADDGNGPVDLADRRVECDGVVSILRGVGQRGGHGDTIAVASPHGR
ncbi:MAG: ATP-binding cassette domain-containing protein [Microbacterium sp.]|nr:ATP-binding cassette domain-containing protein [Microbacterium sp.]